MPFSLRIKCVCCVGYTGTPLIRALVTWETLRSLCVLQSLSIEGETQNRSLYSCVVLISFVIISIDGLVLIYRLRRREEGGGRGLDDFCCVMIKST